MGSRSYDRNIAMVSGNVAKQFGIKRVPEILNAVWPTLQMFPESFILWYSYMEYYN